MLMATASTHPKATTALMMRTPHLTAALVRTKALVPRLTTTRTSKSRALTEGYRSGLEEQVADQLRAAGVDPRFESIKVAYIKPETNHKYTPDFPVTKTLLIETKGRFMPDDRKKHLLLQAQRPDLEVRFVFSRSATPITKGSKTTYAIWCDKHGFKYADKRVPQAWIEEIKAQT